MYAFFRGKIALLRENYVVVDSAGVGYKIFVTTRFLQQTVPGSEETLFTHLVVREDELSLYGFFSEQEKEMFERLVSISGIGPKVALAILSFFTHGEIASAVFASDASAFTKVSGVGKKTAERIVLELKDKVQVGEAFAGGMGVAEDAEMPANEAAQALVSLGYEKVDAVAAVQAVHALADTAEELIVLALKRLDRR